MPATFAKPYCFRCSARGRTCVLSREFIRSHPDLVKAPVLQRRDEAPIDDIVRLDFEQRRLKTRSDDLKAERNRISRSFGDKSLSPEEREDLRAQATAIRDDVAALDAEIDALENRLSELELYVPNVPDPSVPIGE